MAEGVLFNVAERVIEKLGSLAFKEIALLWGVNDELENLTEVVDELKAVLLDAERKQANYQVKRWLQSVENAVYQADDLLDEFYTEAHWRQMVPAKDKVSKQVRIFFSSSNQLAFGLKMGHKIKDINHKLYVVSSRRNFGNLEVNREDTRFIIRERVNHSFVLEENIIGRDDDKKAIVQLLLDPISTENVSTISIVGFGGLGKTALAQLVFNDKKVQIHFEPKMWISVSSEFELNILVEKVIESVTNEKPKPLGMDQLQKILRQKIDGKRYLLVLDDVWNENTEKWISLTNLLMGGAKGSRILITTRSKIVAIKSNTAKPYILEGLKEEQSWSLFKKMAFKDGKEPENLRIKAAAEEIAKKCQGVPLAIRTIAGMLHDSHEETEWLNFKNKKLAKISQEENEILPTLRLSYDVLPSHLKHCFAYCSLFPQDYEIPVERLVKLWVAQGFVKSSDENDCLEDVGYKYYKELLWRSFFQEEKVDEFGTIRSCKMHDLMNELAVLVSGVESVKIDLNRKNFDEKHRHVSFNWNVDSSKWKIPTSLLKAKKIRTFLFLGESSYMSRRTSSKSFCTTITSHFKSLRALSLGGLGIAPLPKCLRKMKHLRYLDLSGNPIERLPNWIVNLQNLETLDLSGCADLVELPRDIQKLINLRHLDLEGCNKLARIPRGLSELTHLRTLRLFVLSDENSAGLDELGMLKDLRGRLRIRNLRHRKDRVRESNDAALMKDKQHLSSLHLQWKDRDVQGVDEDEIIMSMEALQPHSNLQRLHVAGYSGVRLGGWISSLVNIVHLSLHDCDRCQHLPPLDHLLSLKEIRLGNLKNLEYLASSDKADSMGDGMMITLSASPSTCSPAPFFMSLTHLSLFHCPNLKGWWRKVLHENSFFPESSFPCLSKLEIKECPKLTSMPLYPNVEEIVLKNTSWKVLPSSSVTGVWGGGASDLNKLKSLQIGEIEDLECMPEVICSLISLQDLQIECCPNLASLPQGICNLISLQELRIEDCPNLASLPQEIGKLTSLQKLTIGGSLDLTSLPQWIGNLTSLHLLRIRSYPNLRSLPEWISNLASLGKLSIVNCSAVPSLPQGMHRLTSLQELEILDCPILRQRCKKETGEDWHKIVDIPYFYIDLPERNWDDIPSRPKMWSSLKTLMHC